MPVLRQIFGRVNLNGTWIGIYKSEDKNHQEYSGKIVITIKQSFLFLYIVSLTDKFVRSSYGESLLKSNNEDVGINKIIYFYSQERLTSNEEDIPQGASELSILGEKEDKILHGNFWTTKYTKGFLKVKFVSGQCVGSYQEAEKKWSNEQWLTD